MKTLLKIIGWALAIVAVVVIGGWFALKRPDIPYAELDAKYAVPGEKYADLGEGLRVRYVEAGDPKAPTVLLLHGYTASLEGWDAWIKALSGQYHVVAIDLPGHGLTRAPAGWQASPQAYAAVVERFAAKQGLGQFVLVGESMGGWAAWEYALAHPERLQGLVLVDSSGWPDLRARTKEIQSSFMVRALHNPLGRAILEPLDARANLESGLLAAFENDRLVTDAMVDRYWAFNRAPGHRKIITDLFVNYERYPMATAERLAAIRTPTLILQGEKDELVPLDHARQFDAAIPDSRLIVYQGVGHIPPEEASAASAADLLAFLGALKLGAAPAATEETTPAKPTTTESTSPPPTNPLDPSLIFQ